MKNIGILSLYCNNSNYGGLLQAYALCKTIEKLGYQCKQISYDKRIEETSLFTKLKLKIKHPIKYLVFGNWYKSFCLGKKLLKIFELSIPHTEFVTSKTISKLNKDFDIFICGSDQVWNPICGWKGSYFLSFVNTNKKKIAYAASMARNQFTASEAEYAFKMMRGFDALSLRENESIEALKKHNSSFQAEVMPDPTLLLTMEDWNEITSVRLFTESYIFAYFLGNDRQSREDSINYAKSVNKRIIFVYSLLPENRDWEIEHESNMISKVSVNDFLSLIKYADLVLTDSFHGSVFSSIFGVPFLTFNRSKSNSRESMNSRITTLMHILGLHRNIEKLEFGKDYSFSSSEIISIKTELEKQRERGIVFLKKSLIDKH